MHDLARQYTEMWIIFEVFHLQPPPRPTMYSGVGWGCCSDILEAVMGPSGAKTRYFLLFPRLKHAEHGHNASAGGLRTSWAVPPFIVSTRGARLAGTVLFDPTPGWGGTSEGIMYG